MNAKDQEIEELKDRIYLAEHILAVFAEGWTQFALKDYAKYKERYLEKEEKQ